MRFFKSSGDTIFIVYIGLTINTSIIARVTLGRKALIISFIRRCTLKRFSLKVYIYYSSKLQMNDGFTYI